MRSITSELPQHIIQLILSKLPTGNLPISRLVCKAWNLMVLDSASARKFVSNTFLVCRWRVQSSSYKLTVHCIDLNAKHLHLMDIPFTFDYNWSSYVRIVNSCHGLLCITRMVDVRRSCVGILNPMTNEYLQLPYQYKSSYLVLDYGFGFSPRMKRYKVTRFSYDIDNETGILEIFTLGENSNWRRISSYKSNMLYYGCVYLSGCLYWVGKDGALKDVIIGRLDVEDENLEEISLPQLRSHNNVFVGVLNGKLHVTFSFLEDFKFEVWTIMRSSGGKHEWVKEFCVDGIPKQYSGLRRQGEHLQLIKQHEDGEILCCVNRIYLFNYNPNTGRMQEVKQTEENKRSAWIQIDSLNFNSLEHIFAGDGRAEPS